MEQQEKQLQKLTDNLLYNKNSINQGLPRDQFNQYKNGFEILIQVSILAIFIINLIMTYRNYQILGMCYIYQNWVYNNDGWDFIDDILQISQISLDLLVSFSSIFVIASCLSCLNYVIKKNLLTYVSFFLYLLALIISIVWQRNYEIFQIVNQEQQFTCENQYYIYDLQYKYDQYQLYGYWQLPRYVYFFLSIIGAFMSIQQADCILKLLKTSKYKIAQICILLISLPLIYSLRMNYDTYIPYIPSIKRLLK